ncbi:Hypothetical predicted protein [Octopus vulgaris]|uniref:Cyclin-like domain-containing protein n=1 Tax=Octopus vulgaris TaxID=6645 RepID=A0AA36BEY2_OCTVU|nr:Hypothetical predicted protein [Octopus vulgaris]
MKFNLGIGDAQVLQMLSESINKERQQWKAKFFRRHGDTSVTGSQRDWAASWLVSVNRNFHFTPETVSLTLNILDRFLNSVKVPPKYLHCVAVSCFFLAAKTIEEDEVIPSTRELAAESQCGCSVSEILRMEREILGKLDWNLRNVSHIDFLHTIHALLLSMYPQYLYLGNMTPSHQLASLTSKVFRCLCNHRFMVFRPSVLVLAVFSLELESHIFHSWLQLTMMLQKITEVPTDQLINCREECSRYLSSKFHLPKPPVIYGHKKRVCVKRRLEQIEVDEIYDCIKHLYNEEYFSPPTNTEKVLPLSCSQNILQKREEECVKLQPVTAN